MINLLIVPLLLFLVYSLARLFYFRQRLKTSRALLASEWAKELQPGQTKIVFSKEQRRRLANAYQSLHGEPIGIVDKIIDDIEKDINEMLFKK